MFEGFPGFNLNYLSSTFQQQVSRLQKLFMVKIPGSSLQIAVPYLHGIVAHAGFQILGSQLQKSSSRFSGQVELGKPRCGTGFILKTYNM